MKLPRDVSGDGLVKALNKLGYSPVRQVGSHIRLSTEENGEHHVTVPRHSPLRIGTLSGIVSDLAEHHRMSRDEIAKKLFG